MKNLESRILLSTQTLLFSSNKLFNTFREVQKGGKAWLVVNGVPLVEGVLNGRYVPLDEFAFASDWNDVPIVLRHPKQNGGSAKVPDADAPIVGRFYNSKIDEKSSRLVGEFWLDKAMLESVDEGKAMLEAIQSNRSIEVSTGYWSESIPESGKFNGKEYNLIDRNIHPDHIALLPDEVGACSLEDGCGLNRNCQACDKKPSVYQNAVDGTYEKRMNDLYGAFSAMMREGETNKAVEVQDYYIEATADSYVIVHGNGQRFKVRYTYSDGQVTFDDQASWKPVTKIERYVEVQKNVTGSLPEAGKKMWEKVYQSALEQYNDDKEKAAATAWAAVKREYKQDDQGVWHKIKRNNQVDDDLLFELFGLYAIRERRD